VHVLNYREVIIMKRPFAWLLGSILIAVLAVGCGEKTTEKTTTTKETPGGSSTTTVEKSVKTTGDNPPPAAGQETPSKNP
jgi:hypothetical protein